MNGMEDFYDHGTVVKCQSLSHLNCSYKILKNYDSLPNVLKENEINFHRLDKKQEKNNGKLRQNSQRKAHTKISFQQTVETFVVNSHKEKSEKPESSGKNGLFRWFLRFFGLFFLSLRYSPSDNPNSL